MRIRPAARGLILLCALFVALVGIASPARASRALLSEKAVSPSPEIPIFPPPDGQIEGACGVALHGGGIYVSDYYHRAVDVFGPVTRTQILAQPNPLEAETEGPCGLAFAGNDLFVNYWHQRVVRSSPPYGFGAVEKIDSGESTGVAVDSASGDVYVNDRTYVAVYEAAVAGGDSPTQIVGLGGSNPLGDAFGIAASGGKVYVPDAADDTVKVYEPAVDPAEPAFVIDGSETPQGGFNSLVDAAVAVDPTNAHLLVLDNLQPGLEHPRGGIDEFDASGHFLGQLAPPKFIDGEPSGLAFSGGSLFATSGNDEEANVFLFGPYTASLGSESSGFAPLSAPPGPTAGAAPAAVQAPGAPTKRHGARGPGATSSEVVQRGSLRVSFDGKLTPHTLPRHGSAPVKVAVAAKIASSDGGDPPRLRQIAIAINRNGHFTPQGLPVCSLRDIQPSTTANALEACRGSLVGEGHFSAKVLLAQQAPFPSDGKVYAFNGTLHGKPAILAHVYGTDPVPTSFTLPFELRPTKGTFGTTLRASLPSVTGDSGYITGLSLNLGRGFSFHGQRRSYFSAGCPAPAGFPGAVFPFARASFAFAGKGSISSTLTRSCAARG
jgi:DNA-binding beta-propeller fold protein YncE